jgi:site-specific DNA-methyltransferase (adenine-specific)
VDAIVTDPPYGLAFMGANWDYSVPGEMFWREALRVAKPGAHLLAFGGTRTYHRLACAIEDAGWEVRDCIMWVYGSGFPKGIDVPKAIDKAMGAERKKKGDDIIQPFPATPEAAAWKGYGTCLKPAIEPIVVVRKPLEGTVAANVLKYGTGAINIDGCRVPGSWRPKNTSETAPINKPAKHIADHKWGLKEIVKMPSQLGRFPANLIHDGSDEVLALFPESGPSSGMKTFGRVPHDSKVNCYGAMIRTKPWMGVSDEGGSAARFFYCAKVSRSERGEGNVHPTVKPLALMRYLVRLVTRKGGIVLDPFMGSGTTGVAAIQEGMNFVGIERDPHYYDIASRRVNDAMPLPTTITQQELPL